MEEWTGQAVETTIPLLLWLKTIGCVVADLSCAHSTGGGLSVAADFQAENSRETMPRRFQQIHLDVTVKRDHHTGAGVGDNVTFLNPRLASSPSTGGRDRGGNSAELRFLLAPVAVRNLWASSRQGSCIVSDRDRAHLNELFRALLRLHKALLDDERVSYERVHGRIPSNGAFLQLVLGDAWFAWLRPLSQLMAQLDDLGEASSEAPDTATLIASIRTLLTPTQEGEGFGKQYHDALQREPDVMLAHAAVKTLLR